MARIAFTSPYAEAEFFRRLEAHTYRSRPLALPSGQPQEDRPHLRRLGANRFRLSSGMAWRNAFALHYFGSARENPDQTTNLEGELRLTWTSICLLAIPLALVLTLATVLLPLGTRFETRVLGWWGIGLLSLRYLPGALGPATVKALTEFLALAVQARPAPTHSS